MHPATYEPEQIIEVGLALQAEGRNITWFALRNQGAVAIRHVSSTLSECIPSWRQN